jgi:hypothetical protein
MAALTGPRDTLERLGATESYPLAAGATLFAGALVVLDAGYAKPGVTDTGLKAVGRAEESVDNASGADGAKAVTVRRGCFRYANSAGGDAIGQADVEGTCYVVDDATVAKTDGTGTRSVAGTIRAVDALGVWVQF